MLTVGSPDLDSPPESRAKRLYEWVAFLDQSAVVIAIQVPRHIDAYRMFETLNDRGLRASQIDICLRAHEDEE